MKNAMRPFTIRGYVSRTALACSLSLAAMTAVASSVSADDDVEAEARTTHATVTQPPEQKRAPVSRGGTVEARRLPSNAERMRAPGSDAGEHCTGSSMADDASYAFSIDGAPVDTDGTRNTADSHRCTDVALYKADIQVRYDGAPVEPRLNIVASPEGAATTGTISFATYTNYALFIERADVLIYEREQRAHPLAVVPLRNGVATWRAPAHAPKELLYVLRVYDAQGRFDETTPKRLGLGIARNGAGQHDRERLASVYGETALAVRNIPVRGGSVLVAGRNVAEGHRVRVMGLPVPVDHKGDFAVQQIVTAGPQPIDVAVYDAKGPVATFTRQAHVPDRDFFYVGMADLTVGTGRTSGPSAAALEPAAGDAYADKVYVNGRVAFYLKGKIRGDTLLTASVDTREQPLRHLFSNFDSKDPRYLLRNLDPNKYYPVYGDDSTLVEDAPTRGKFYVRLDRGDASVMWGNFKTTVTGTEFVRYERGLYGGRAQAKSERSTSFGDRQTRAEVFAAEPGTLGARDVFLGTGGSSYFLRRQNITMGSERLTVEVRDRTTGLVLRTRPLVAGEDYEVNYLQGRVLLRTALASAAEGDFIIRQSGLGNHDQVLVVHYEYAPDLHASKDRVVGGRVQQWVLDRILVGVTGYDQTAPGEPVRILGADVTYRHAAGTYVKVEGARSRGPGSGESLSIDGGFTFDTRSTNGIRAYAKRVELAADLADFVKGGEGRLTAFWKDKDRDYSGPGELAIGRAAREFGARADLRLTKEWSSRSKVEGRADEFRNYAAVEQNMTRILNDNWKLTFGVRSDNNSVRTKSMSPVLNQNGRRTDVGLRADYDPKSYWTAYGYGQLTLAHSGERERNDRIGAGGSVQLSERMKLLGELSYGTSGVGAIVGTDYRIDEKRNSYLKYALDPDRTDIISRGGTGALTIGARERFFDNVSVFAEERVRHGAGFSGMTHAFGLDFVPYHDWKAGIALETGKLSDPYRGDLARTAVSTSLGYGRPGIAYAGKFEYRHDTIVTTTQGESKRDVFLTNNALSMKMNPDWRFIGRANGSYSTSTLGDFYRGDYAEGIVGFAYRPVQHDRLNALFKYTYFYDLPSPGQRTGASAVNFAQQSHVLSVDAMYDVSPLVTIGGKYAMRSSEIRDVKASGAWFESDAHLLVARIDLHVIKEWDVVAEWRRLSVVQADDSRSGGLLGVYRHLGDNFKIGAGYNFTNFSDDLTDLSTRHRGVFVNALGKF